MRFKKGNHKMYLLLHLKWLRDNYVKQIQKQIRFTESAVGLNPIRFHLFGADSVIC